MKESPSVVSEGRVKELRMCCGEAVTFCVPGRVFVGQHRHPVRNGAAAVLCVGRVFSQEEERMTNSE